MKKRALTHEERDLWRRATRNVAPFSAAAKLAPGPLRDMIKTAAPKKDLLRSGARVTPQPGFRVEPQGSRKPVFTTPSAFESGDPKFDRHARRGRLRIEATLDLHGHTQLSARAVLSEFIARARQRGFRCVLVITGKGAKVSAGARPGAGVLRARFHDWMREESFRQHIVRASPAHPRHGGGGAFYVFLKR